MGYAHGVLDLEITARYALIARMDSVSSDCESQTHVKHMCCSELV